MGYALKIEGKLIEFPSKADAEAFLRDQVLGLAQASPAKQKRNGKLVLRFKRDPRAQMVENFISTLTGAGPKGATTSKIMEAVGIESPQAFGNRGMNINRLLAKLGFDPDEVYTNDRNDRGDREWKPGPRAAEALEAVSKIPKG